MTPAHIKGMEPLAPHISVLDEIPAYAMTLNARQLATVRDYSFRLDRHNADLDVIARIRSEHEEALGTAEEIAFDETGLAKHWHDSALWSSLHSESGATGRAAALWKVDLWWPTYLGSPALAVLVGVLQPIPASLGWGVLVAVVLAWLLAFPRLLRQPTHENLPAISRTDTKLLYDDVVNAILAGVLTATGKGFSPEELAALTRRWEHLKFVCATTQTLSAPPAPRLRLVKTKAAPPVKLDRAEAA